ncbi:hypothetical protein JKF63_04675 [Porcisia hertigi]|uniref:Uncharacterized protein n=1 Tax=Porcisia hertigi TaxID=2761500 RepID=A0A836I105_9TRYP|nr:hypothetical protein JKF63_04675 [Porcisia hertigi]
MFAPWTLFGQRRIAKGLIVRPRVSAEYRAYPPFWTAQQQQCRYSSCVSDATAAPSPDAGKGNCFDFFQLTKHPDIDVAVLQKTYHNLQRLVHPDQQQVQANEQLQRQQQADAANGPPTTSASPSKPGCSPDTPVSNADVSTYANAAYETLRTPYARCRYLSRLVKAEEVKGGPLSAAEEEELLLVEDDRRTMKAREVRPDAPMSEDFLMEMLSINELIFGNDPSDENVRQQWTVLRFDLEDRAVGYYQDAVKSWNEGNMSGFHHVVQEWTYIANALEKLKERMI